MWAHVFLILGFSILLASADVAKAQTQACQISRAEYLIFYQKLYITMIDQQIYPLKKNVNQIVSPFQNPAFQAQLCKQIQLTQAEVKEIQVHVYSNYFGLDDSSQSTQAKLRDLLIQEARSPEVLQAFAMIDRVRFVLRSEEMSDSQKMSQLVQYMNGLSQQQLRLLLDSSKDLFPYIAGSDSNADNYIELLKRAYPTPEELVQHLSGFNLLDDEDYQSVGATQLRTQFAKSLQAVRMDPKMACTVVSLNLQSETSHRRAKEFEDLIDTLHTLFPETEKYEDTVCLGGPHSTMTVKNLRKKHIDELKVMERKPKHLNFSTPGQVVAPPVSPVRVVPQGVQCLEQEMTTQFEAAMKQAHPQARALFGFNDSRGCSYSFDIQPQRKVKGTIKISFQVRVLHPSFMLSEVGEGSPESLTADVLKTIEKMGIKLEAPEAAKSSFPRVK